MTDRDITLLTRVTPAAIAANPELQSQLIPILQAADSDGQVNAEDRKQQVLAETGGYGADVVIECVGYPDAVNEGLEYCRDGARFATGALLAGLRPERERRTTHLFAAAKFHH